ncbi:hypothetical protein L195_g030846, partial [Trifolium pratense]
IMRTLIPEFDHVVVTIEEGNLMDTLKIEDKKNIQCYNCEKWGHYANDCWHGNGKQKAKYSDDDANLAQDDSNVPMMMKLTSLISIKAEGAGNMIIKKNDGKLVLKSPLARNRTFQTNFNAADEVQCMKPGKAFKSHPPTRSTRISNVVHSWLYLVKSLGGNSLKNKSVTPTSNTLFDGSDSESEDNIRENDVAIVTGIEELAAIERNNTWELVKLPHEKKAIEVKWVYKLKHNHDGSIAKQKARLVARGFLQKVGLDYSEVYAPLQGQKQ